MAKRNGQRKRRKQNPYLPFIGGLIFIGIAVVMHASGNSKNSPAAAGRGGVLPIEINSPAPRLALQNLQGETMSLADYQGQVVLVNNWATWCPPCKAEMPVLEAYYEDHAEEGFMIIAVEAGEPKDVVAQFADQYHLTFQVWLDPEGASARAIGNGNLPNSFVIDRSGEVRYAWTGEVNRNVLEKYVTPLLAEQ